MLKVSKPGQMARRVALGCVLGAGVALLAGSRIAGADTAPSNEVTIDNFTFKPAALKVKVGTDVTWVNRDDIPHSIVVQSLNVHSHPMDTDQTFSFKFDKAGVYNYVCGIHPHMHAQVVVTN